MAQDSHAHRGDGCVDAAVGQAQLQGHFTNRDFEFKELDDPQPLERCQPTGVDPAAGEVVKRILAARAPVSFIDQLVQVALPTAGAKPVSIFAALFRQVSESGSLT